jgi:hypothetical protein
MLPPHKSKIALYLIMQSDMLGIVRADGMYRLFCFDELLLDRVSTTVHDEHWSLELEEFIEQAKIFNHALSGEIFLEFYPEAQNQQMLELAWKDAISLSPALFGELIKAFKPVQYGRLEKD